MDDSTAQKNLEKGRIRTMIRLTINRFLAFILFTSSICGCSPQAKTSYLIRDMEHPPRVIQDTFSAKGISDYILLDDEGYPFRLVYLCENRVYNFIEEPEKNFLLTSFQPILDTPIERKLSGDDRRRIWACQERKVWEEQSHVVELKRRVMEERLRLQSVLPLVRLEQNRIRAEIEERKKAEEEKQRRLETEIRRNEEERQRKAEEEQRRKAEEERKIKNYKAGESERVDPVLPPPPIKITERGVFLVMKETPIYEDSRIDSKIQGQGKKYDVFEVLNTRKDQRGIPWHQVLVRDRFVSTKGKRSGWTPEERFFWVKNKLLAWVFPGDPSKSSTVKPLKINVEDLQFTGKKVSTPDRNTLYEVIYEVNLEFAERILGWIEERNGIRRSDKNPDEMRALLKDLAYTLWPLPIQTDVLRGQIRVGFTPEQVILSWGKPDHINKTRTLVGVHEQWVYGENPFPNTYVYIENGEVKSWEFLRSGTKP
ncbi:MAG: hypothetical protein H6Q43_750 [Deltaproteobacteria bacterium]|nr:hypothetical protein [Deltaproteobacteria bacterium]